MDLDHDDLEEKIAAYTQYGNFEVLDNWLMEDIYQYLEVNLDIQIGELVSVSDYVDAILSTTDAKDETLHVCKSIYEIGEWVYGSKFERLMKPYEDKIL